MPADTPTDGRCNYEYSPDDDYDPNSGFCEAYPMDNGRCFHHGGQRQNGGAPEDNDNAATHEAYKELAKKQLSEGEQRAFEEVSSQLDDPDDSREIARHAASYCLLMGHRTGDERWFRRFEGICDTFDLAPEEIKHHEVEVDGSVTHDVEHGLDRDTQEILDDLTGGV
jgi:hypothetical protein